MDVSPVLNDTGPARLGAPRIGGEPIPERFYVFVIVSMLLVMLACACAVAYAAWFCYRRRSAAQ